MKEIKIIENNIEIANAKIEKNILIDIQVQEMFRNISFGRKVLIKAIEQVKSEGYDEILVTDYTPSSEPFFIKYGFVKSSDGILVLSGLKKQRIEKKSIYICSTFSLVINLLLAVLKIGAGNIFGLATFIADGINSATDSLTSLLALASIRISNKPEDDSHPFGYGKIESIFNLIIGILIFISTFGVLVDNIKKIFINKTYILDDNQTLIYILSITFVVLKILQYLYVKHYATKYKNEILKTLLKDYMSDILISSSVVIGVFMTLNISYVIDILLGILISLYILYQAGLIIYGSISELMERQDKLLLRKVRTTIMSDNNIFYVHDLFMIRSGKDIYMYADARMDKNFNVQKAHEIAENVSLKVEKMYNIKRLTLHVEPIYIQKKG